MPNYCTVCFNNTRKRKGCAFFVYPRDQVKRHQWLRVVGRQDLIAKLDEPKHRQHYKICEFHFDSNCIKFTASKTKRRLTENAFPTVNLPVLIEDPVSERTPERELAFNEADSAGATGQSSTAQVNAEELEFEPSTSTAGGSQYQPSTSTREELQYQPYRYSMNAALEEVILIKEEITDEEKNQCRLCLSVGRRMQKLGEYAPLYRKLLFENNFQNTTIPCFMYHMLACWECLAELRRVERFQDKVRKANNAFETNQNQNCESLSDLSTILIGDYKKSDEEESEKLSRVEECAQEIKEEAVEVEIEETTVPDPLEFNQGDRKKEWAGESLDIQNESNISVPTQKVKYATPEPKTAQDVPKRARLDQTVTSGPKRPKLDQSGPKTAQEQENEPIITTETDPEAIFRKVQIEINELVKILAERRNIESFKNMKFKCDSCILGFTNHNRLLEHNRNFHNQKLGCCECAICERRFTDERRLSAHYRNHFAKFVCKLCNYECYTKTGQAIHFKRHKGVMQGLYCTLLRQRQSSDQRSSAS